MNPNLKLSFQQFSLLLLAVFFLGTCQTPTDQVSDNMNTLFNQEVIAEDGAQVLVGRLNRQAWQKAPYQEWFEEEYNAYEVDEMTLAEVKTATNSIEIKVFLGTWCSDSRRELPRFYKVLEALDFDESRLTVVGLDNHPDRYKQSPQQEEVGWDIEYVPTFIFLQNGKEIGRIIESPNVSLEVDLVGILTSGEV